MGEAPASDGAILANWRQTLEDASEKHRLAHLLVKIPLFAKAPEAFRLAVVDRLRPVIFKANTKVWRQRQQGDWLGIVLSGRLDVSIQRGNFHSDMKMAEVAPGGYVGDIGLLGISETRTVSVTAAQETMVAVLEKASFEEVVAEAGEDQLSIVQDSKGMQGIMADKETFCELKCFRKLERDFILALFDYLEPRLVYPGTVLMREGNYGNEMYILHIGKIRVDRAGKFITECNSGVVLGELAVLGLDNRRTASVTACQVCFIYVLHGDVFKEILQKFPESRKVFDHAYIAKLLRHELEKSKDEKSKLDRFYGSAHPMLELEVQEYMNTGEQPAALLDRADSSLKVPV